MQIFATSRWLTHTRAKRGREDGDYLGAATKMSVTSPRKGGFPQTLASKSDCVELFKFEFKILYVW